MAAAAVMVVIMLKAKLASSINWGFEFGNIVVVDLHLIFVYLLPQLLPTSGKSPPYKHLSMPS